MPPAISLAEIIPLFDTIAQYLEGAVVVLLPLELIWLAFRHELHWPRIKEMLASASTLLPLLLLSAPILAAHVTLCYGVAEIRPWPIGTDWLSAALCLILVDFIYYWEHRFGHEIRGLWALYHSVHHSSPLYDQTTALRVSVIDLCITPFFYLPAILVGFDPLLVLVSFGIVIGYQTWLHTETIGRLGWFDAIFNSPANHRVHHATQRAYLDKNYGAILMIWDRLFGTYRAETEKPVYGLTDPIQSVNPVTVHGLEIMRFVRDWRQTGGLHLLWRMFWHRPGWRPAAEAWRPQR